MVSLFSIVFVLTLWSVYNAAYNQAQREFVARLQVGKNVFLNEINIAKGHLDSSVETIAKDWALRSAIGQGEDTESITSVLRNHGNRIDADIALVVNNEFALIAHYGGESLSIDQSLEHKLNSKQKRLAWISLVDEMPYIMSAEPIKAPSQIGWLIMGKQLNKEFLNRIKSLISLDINLLVVVSNESNLTLSTQVHNEMTRIELQSTASQFVNQDSKMEMLTLSAEEAVVLPFILYEDKSNKYVVLLQDSISAWLITLNVFLWELVPFFIVGILLAVLGSYYIARSITRPVGRLLDAAKLVASGSYTEKIQVSGKSELGELAREFGNMQGAVMEREQKIKDQAEEIKQTHKIKYQVEIARREQQLAESATEAKSRFLANVSHEIRTPLNSIIGYSEMLNDKQVNVEDKAKATEAINSGGRYLLSIINDVLDLSKIEAGKIELEHIDTCVVSLVAEVKSYMEGFARQKDLTFGMQFSLPLPMYFSADPTRLKQILLNLCNNAIKFTSEGRVDLQVVFDPSKKRFIFVVADTGPGMSDEQQLRLFTAFSQGNQSTNRKYGGTGLGLYISKQLTEMMDGHIKVTSQVGEGSQFAVYLPWVEAQNDEVLNTQAQVDKLISNKQPDEVSVPSIKARILCADDNDDNRRLVAYLLEKTGAEVIMVEDGQQAVETALSEEFDLVLMDMQMPEMDGLQATSLLKQAGFEQPIIMLTANVDTTSKKQIADAGADGHFAKPIDTVRFYALLSELLTSQEDISKSSNTVSLEYEKLVQNYKQSLTTKLVELQNAFSEKDWENIEIFAHKMKGAAGSFGFDQLSQVAGQAENCIRQQDLDTAAIHLSTLLALLEQQVNTEEQCPLVP